MVNDNVVDKAAIEFKQQKMCHRLRRYTRTHIHLVEGNNMLLGKGIMINWNNVAPEHRPAYDAWHCHEHMVGRLKIPGFMRGRRYIAHQAHQARRNFLTMYEVADLSVLTGADYLAKANAPSALTLRTTPLVLDSIRGLARVRMSLGVGTGGCALTLRFDPLQEREQTLEHYLVDSALPAIAQRVDIAGAHLIVADRDASSMTPVERQGRPTTLPNWIVLVEGFTFDAVSRAADAVLSDTQLTAQGCAPGMARDSYSLQFMQLASA